MSEHQVDPYDAFQYLLLNPQAESIDFYQQRRKREVARKAFIEIDNDQAMRRAVLRRVRPHHHHHHHPRYTRDVLETKSMAWTGKGHPSGRPTCSLDIPSRKNLSCQRSGHGVFQYEDLTSQGLMPVTPANDNIHNPGQTMPDDI